MCGVQTSKEFNKFLDKHRNLAPKIIKALEEIAQNPYHNQQDTKKLQGEFYPLVRDLYDTLKAHL